MTWIVGAPTMFGYGFAISDVRVTLQDGSEVDCLQKLFSIGRHLAAGFAGSVMIGFAMIDELRRMADFDDPRMACDPGSIATQWPAQARQIFASFSSEEQKAQCHLMLVCVDPRLDVSVSTIPQSHVYIFKSPQFDLEVVTTQKLGSIGSGLESEECRALIDSFSTNFKRREMFWRGEIGQSGGMASMVGSALTSILKRVAPRGVSTHLNYCWVYRGRTIIATNDHLAGDRWTVESLGSGVNDPDHAASMEQFKAAALTDNFTFEMPCLAASWDDLCKILQARGASASECTA
jgi:hypothetical protein